MQKATIKPRRTALKVVIALLVIAAIGGVAAAVFFYGNDTVTQNRYDEALAALDAKDYNTAAPIFAELGTYEDSASKLVECARNNVSVTELTVGSEFWFGVEPSANAPICWIVVSSGRIQTPEGDSVATLELISKYVLSVPRPYHDTLTSTLFWRDSSLRAWLHSDFLDGFSAQQKALLPLVNTTDEAADKPIDSPMPGIVLFGSIDPANVGVISQDYVRIPSSSDMIGDFTTGLSWQGLVRNSDNSTTPVAYWLRSASFADDDQGTNAATYIKWVEPDSEKNRYQHNVYLDEGTKEKHIRPMITVVKQ
jgi:hypothetical protein